VACGNTVGKCLESGLPGFVPMGLLVVSPYDMDVSHVLKNIRIVMNAWKVASACDFTLARFQRRGDP